MKKKSPEAQKAKRKVAPRQQTTMRIPEDTLAAFDACAEKRGISRSLLLNQVIAKFVRDDRSRSVQGVV
jgi:metal-responsive CopG/Arc/MetJ family transcriptional regulator